jgi:hypothetical protein
MHHTSLGGFSGLGIRHALTPVACTKATTDNHAALARALDGAGRPGCAPAALKSQAASAAFGAAWTTGTAGEPSHSECAGIDSPFITMVSGRSTA